MMKGTSSMFIQFGSYGKRVFRYCMCGFHISHILECICSEVVLCTSPSPVKQQVIEKEVGTSSHKTGCLTLDGTQKHPVL